MNEEKARLNLVGVLLAIDGDGNGSGHSALHIG
jgi:hypothetical protein